MLGKDLTARWVFWLTREVIGSSAIIVLPFPFACLFLYRCLYLNLWSPLPYDSSSFHNKAFLLSFLSCLLSVVSVISEHLIRQASNISEHMTSQGCNFSILWGSGTAWVSLTLDTPADNSFQTKYHNSLYQKCNLAYPDYFFLKMELFRKRPQELLFSSLADSF